MDKMNELSEDVLLCLYNCAREMLEFYQFDADVLECEWGIDLEQAQEWRSELAAAYDQRPDVLTDRIDWAGEIAEASLSPDAMGSLTDSELVIIIVSILTALSYLDDESQFETRIGTPPAFALSLFEGVERSAQERDVIQVLSDEDDDRQAGNDVETPIDRHFPSHDRFHDIVTREQYADRVYDTIVNGTHSAALRNGRTKYFSARSNTVVITNPNCPDQGTCYPAGYGSRTYDWLR